jgi:hypothetical protein
VNGSPQPGGLDPAAAGLMLAATAVVADFSADKLVAVDPQTTLAGNGSTQAIRRSVLLLLAKQLRLLGRCEDGPRRVAELPAHAVCRAATQLASLPADASDEQAAAWSRDTGLEGWVDQAPIWQERLEDAARTARSPSAAELEEALTGREIALITLAPGFDGFGPTDVLELVLDDGQLLTIDASREPALGVAALSFRRNGAWLPRLEAPRTLRSLERRRVTEAAVAGLGEQEQLELELSTGHLQLQVTSWSAAVTLADSPAAVEARRFG